MCVCVRVCVCVHFWQPNQKANGRDQSLQSGPERIPQCYATYTATRCNTPNALQHTKHSVELYVIKQRTLQHPATRCNTQLHAATHCVTLQHRATVARHPALLHAATRCNTLYDTATPCNSRSTPSAMTSHAGARASAPFFLIAQYI